MEVGFAELDADPLGALRRIYAALSLPAFEGAEPAMQAYVAGLGLRGFKRNAHRRGLEGAGGCGASSGEAWAVGRQPVLLLRQRPVSSGLCPLPPLALQAAEPGAAAARAPALGALRLPPLGLPAGGGRGGGRRLMARHRWLPCCVCLLPAFLFHAVQHCPLFPAD